MTQKSAPLPSRLLDPIDRISEWLFGLVAQRTRAYQTDLDIQRGLLLGLSHKKLDFTVYLFNLGWDDPMVVFAIGVYL